VKKTIFIGNKKPDIEINKRINRKICLHPNFNQILYSLLAFEIHTHAVYSYLSGS